MSGQRQVHHIRQIIIILHPPIYYFALVRNVTLKLGVEGLEGSLANCFGTGVVATCARLTRYYFLLDCQVFDDLSVRVNIYCIQDVFINRAVIVQNRESNVCHYLNFITFFFSIHSNRTFFYNISTLLNQLRIKQILFYDKHHETGRFPVIQDCNFFLKLWFNRGLNQTVSI